MLNKNQDLYVFMEQNKNASITNVKAGNMFLNRFCIDEDAAFELNEVNYLKKLNYGIWNDSRSINEKGKNTSL